MVMVEVTMMKAVAKVEARAGVGAEQAVTPVDPLSTGQTEKVERKTKMAETGMWTRR